MVGIVASFVRNPKLKHRLMESLTSFGVADAVETGKRGLYARDTKEHDAKHRTPREFTEQIPRGSLFVGNAIAKHAMTLPARRQGGPSGVRACLRPKRFRIAFDLRSPPKEQSGAGSMYRSGRQPRLDLKNRRLGDQVFPRATSDDVWRHPDRRIRIEPLGHVLLMAFRIGVSQEWR
jgi:hypothetical protein